MHAIGGFTLRVNTYQQGTTLLWPAVMIIDIVPSAAYPRYQIAFLSLLPPFIMMLTSVLGLMRMMMLIS